MSYIFNTFSLMYFSFGFGVRFTNLYMYGGFSNQVIE